MANGSCSKIAQPLENLQKKLLYLVCSVHHYNTRVPKDPHLPPPTWRKRKTNVAAPEIHHKLLRTTNERTNVRKVSQSVVHAQALLDPLVDRKRQSGGQSRLPNCRHAAAEKRAAAFLPHYRPVHYRRKAINGTENWEGGTLWRRRRRRGVFLYYDQNAIL